MAGVDVIDANLEGVEVVKHAMHVATWAHAGQKRKHLPDDYIQHPMRVYLAARDMGLSYDVQAAALLHDVLEDTDTRLPDEMPERVKELVALLSKWWSDDDHSDERSASEACYYERIAKDPEASALKLLNRADNLRDMVRVVRTQRKWAQRYLQRTEAELAGVRAACPYRLVVSAFDIAVTQLATAIRETPSV